MSTRIDDPTSYGLKIGCVYVFNLIVGTGSLAMPKAFEHAGYVLSTVLLIFLTLMSFITATFMVETMAIANAVARFKRQQVSLFAFLLSYVNISFVYALFRKCLKYV